MSSEERELCCSLSTFLRDHFRYGTHATRYNASYGKAVGRSRHGRNKDHVWMATELQNITISLPNNKTITWADKIASMLEEGNTKAKRLERCIGRFVNIGMILLYAHHFGLDNCTADVYPNPRQGHCYPITPTDLQGWPVPNKVV